MAHHERVRDDLAAWQAPNTPVSSEEFEQFDDQVHKSINGDEGGVWAPSAQIEIGGEGLLVSGTLEASGTVEFSGSAFTCVADASFSNDVAIGNASTDDLTVGATSVFNAPATFNDNVTIGVDNTDTLTINAATTFANDVTIGSDAIDTLDVHSTATFHNAVEFTDDVLLGNGGQQCIVRTNLVVQADMEIQEDLLVTGASEFDGDMQVDGDMSFGGSSVILGQPTLGVRMQFQDSGRVPLRMHAVPDSNTTVDPTTDGNWIYGVGLSEPRAYTIEGSSVPGDFLLVTNATPTSGGFNMVMNFPEFTLTVGPEKTSIFICRGSGAWTAAIHEAAGNDAGDD